MPQENDQNTPYHGITKPAYEKDPWDTDYYDFIDVVDGQLIMVDTLTNRPSSPPADSLYFAIDEGTGTLYRYDSGSSSWVIVAGTDIQSSSDIDHDSTTGGTDSDAHHIRPSAGNYITDSSNTFNVDIGSGLQDDGSGNIESEPQFVYDPGMSEWGSSQSSVEIDRISLATGETLEIDRIELQQNGGGSSTDISIDVYDETGATVVGSVNLGSVTKDPGSSGTGNDVIIRFTNSTASSIQAAPRVIGRISGA